MECHTGPFPDSEFRSDMLLDRDKLWELCVVLSSEGKFRVPGP